MSQAWLMIAKMNRDKEEARLGAAFDKRVAELSAEAAILPITIYKQDANRVRFSYTKPDGRLAFSKWYTKGEDALAYCRRWHMRNG